jgi:acetyl/propionyl-CoA carboxylase alpha subunit
MAPSVVHGSRATVDDGPDAIQIRDDRGGRFIAEGSKGLHRVTTALVGDTVWVGIDGQAIEFTIEGDGALAAAASTADASLTPPMSATVARVAVRPGDRVEAGDTLVVLEAMKMELPIREPRASVVRAVHCAEGQLVHPGMRLVELGDEP